MWANMSGTQKAISSLTILLNTRITVPPTTAGVPRVSQTGLLQTFELPGDQFFVAGLLRSNCLVTPRLPSGFLDRL